MSLLIGSHVGVSGEKMLLGAVEEALSYGANTFMFYTGAPQNTIRVPIARFRLEEANQLMLSAGIKKENVVVHAPYIINLANTVNESTFELAVNFLKQELSRVEALGFRYVVLHPGSHVGAGVDAALTQIIKGLNIVLKDNAYSGTTILLETMSGKGSEVGNKFEHLKYIIDHVEPKGRLGVCLDTCHINDAGYDVTQFDQVLGDFDKIIGLSYLKVVHLNDSKNSRGAAKDRHENIGYGTIGFATLEAIAHHPKLANLPKILETPYINDGAPYREEIKMLVEHSFNANLKPLEPVEK